GTPSVTFTPSVTPPSTPTVTLTATASETPPSGGTATPTPGASNLLPPSAPNTGGYNITMNVTDLVSDSLWIVNAGVGSGEPTGETITATLTTVAGLDVLTAAGPSVPTDTTSLEVYVIQSPGMGGGSANSLYVGNISIAKGSATASPVPNGPVKIIATLPAPDPWTGSEPGNITVELAGNADDVTLKVYTKALVLVGSFDFGPQPAGWDPLPMPPAMYSLPDGLYYYTLSATRNGEGLAPTLGKLYILR
ncbi:MAG: FlgD immunoglobulin-like domain containing protein, partial [bacterium]